MDDVVYSHNGPPDGLSILDAVAATPLQRHARAPSASCRLRRVLDNGELQD